VIPLSQSILEQPVSNFRGWVAVDGKQLCTEERLTRGPRTHDVVAVIEVIKQTRKLVMPLTKHPWKGSGMTVVGESCHARDGELELR
jgi:hypothetical protein